MELELPCSAPPADAVIVLEEEADPAGPKKRSIRRFRLKAVEDGIGTYVEDESAWWR